MKDSANLKDYRQVRQLAIRSLFEIVEQSSEGTVIVDKDARIVWMNEATARPALRRRWGRKWKRSFPAA